MSISTWPAIALNLGIGFDALLHLLLQGLQPRHLGTNLFGLELVHIDRRACGHLLATLDLAIGAREILPAALDDVGRVTLPEPPPISESFKGDAK
jgi:hypothetical protein